MYRRNIPILAVVASLLMSGGGQFYNRLFFRAVAFGVLYAVLLYRFGMVAYVVNVASAIEAGAVALLDQRDEEEY